MAHTTIDDAYAQALTLLDPHRRAWVVAVVRFAGVGERIDLTQAVPLAILEGLFPSGPFAFQVRGMSAMSAELVGGPDCPVGRVGDSADRYVSLRMCSGTPGTLAVGLTRSGRLDDGSVEPSHVLLSDAESVLTDTCALVQACLTLLDHRGVVELLLRVACDIPGRPVELRVYDEDCGDTLCPPSGRHAVAPLRLSTVAPISQVEAERVVWEAASTLATAFGASRPQLLGQARSDRADIPLRQIHPNMTSSGPVGR
ncbi:hypothetical protein KEM60_03217 [Austwickia sp. TVS 96-490-7B]|uniref:hypothetical protein n=1 Tax=Austwickia sp. TVS 96-490-7B TaxID=2830843 RepID=UPI001C56092C|nr:hypothetical protein [Austwickia sp. TVS 96-490-7B]MBW3086987.1 hypothetical protein [Austwickia sp. TVS 96-490-7B]